MNYDQVLIKIGEFGKYQKILYFFAVGLPGLSSGIFMVISVFLLGVPDHRCAIPGLTNDTFDLLEDDPRKMFVHMYIPQIKDDDGKLTDDPCNYYILKDNVTTFDNDSRPTNAEKVKCSSWVYSEKIFDSTFSKAQNIICDSKENLPIYKSLFFAGVLVGALGLGILSDVIGRKKTLYLSFILLSASSIGVAFSPNVYAFVCLRFLVGVSNAGMFMTGFVIGMELVGPSKRIYAGVINEYFFALGLVVLSGVAYLLRDWYTIELAVSIPTVLYLLYGWYFPESPRWLMNKGRIQEAEAILRRAGEVNGVKLGEKILDIDDSSQKPASGNLFQLFTSRVMLIRTLVIFFNWMVVSMTYYGLSLNTGNLGGDFYVNFLISGLVEFPAYTLVILFLDRWGRKKMHCASMLLGGIACLCTILTISFLSEDLQPITTTLAMIGKLGSAAGFAIIYIFSAELYPTVVRNAGMGASSCCARIGGILAPYVADSGDLIGGKLGKAVPLIIFGAASVVAGLLSLMLPETLGECMPETIEDGRIFGTDEYRSKSSISITIDAPVEKKPLPADGIEVTKI